MVRCNFTYISSKDPDYHSKYREKNRARIREQAKKHYEKNKERIKEKVSKYREDNKEQVKEGKVKYRAGNKEKIKEDKTKYYEDLKQHTVDSILNGKIIDQNKWDMLINIIKGNAKKHPYSDDFTNDIVFDKMLRGCFFCGDIATTIDRIDSTLDHTPINCVGCCKGCNNSKGVTDPSTFIRKSYYRARGHYIDDISDIWFSHKNKPRFDIYKKSAEKKGVPFELTKTDFEELLIGECEYCHRAPTTWFGVDRKIPSKGYVLGNAAPCCFDCNVDKHINDAETTFKRNVCIANRVDTGELFIEEYEKMILHTGIQGRTNKVSVYGKIYESMSEASRALGRGTNYVCECIRKGRFPDDIFKIFEEF